MSRSRRLDAHRGAQVKVSNIMAKSKGQLADWTDAPSNPRRMDPRTRRDLKASLLAFGDLSYPAAPFRLPETDAPTRLHEVNMARKITKAEPKPAPKPDSLADRAEATIVHDALTKQAAGEHLTRAEIGALRRYEQRRDAEHRAEVFRWTTQAELCALLATDPKVIREWVRAGMPGRTQQGRSVLFDLWQVLPWIKERWLFEFRAAESDSPALERYRAARAKREELELGRMEGRLLDRDEVQAGRVARLVALRRGLMSIPRAAAPALAETQEPREVEAYLREKIHELLRAYAAGVQDGER